MAALLLPLAVLATLFTPAAASAVCSVSRFQELSHSDDGFFQLVYGTLFGSAVTNIGDLDGDGINDMAVGATGDSANTGAVYNLLMYRNGTVKGLSKISATEGNFTGVLTTRDYFGQSLTNMGDLDGDGINDMAVGALYDDLKGAVYMLFMHRNGTVKDFSKISDTQDNFTAVLENYDGFGYSVTNMGDLDGDGINDMAVGSSGNEDGDSADTGAVYIVFMNRNGTVKGLSKISATEGNFTVVLQADNQFGRSVTNMGDLDGDGINDMAVGAKNDDGVSSNKGAVYTLLLHRDGTVKNVFKMDKIADVLENGDLFGKSMTNMGDLDGDGINDLAVGALYDADGGTNTGAVYTVFMNRDGTVKGLSKISATQGNFTDVLEAGDQFGSSVTNIGDLDGDGINDMAVGAYADYNYKGAVYVIFSNCTGPCLNNIQDGDETGIDCGGSCAPCPVCTNPKIEYSGCGNLAISDVNSVTINGDEVQTSSRRERRASERIEALEAKVQAFAKKLEALESNM